MARSLTAGIITEVTAKQLSPIMLVKAAFDSGDLNLWTGGGSIVYNGDTYVGAGNLLSISGVTESTNLQADNVTFTLSSIPASNLSLALNENYQGRKISCWFGCLNASGALVSSPFLLFKGRMDIMALIEGGPTCTLGMVCENILIDFGRPKTRLYTNEDQLALYPNDTALKYIIQLQDKELIWGRANPPK